MLHIFEKHATIENIGWALLHSLWQISLIALVLFFSLRILKNASANVRYLFSISALFLALIMPITTFTTLSPTRNIQAENYVTKFNSDIENSSSSPLNKIPQTIENTNNSTEKVESGEKNVITFANVQTKVETVFTKFLPYLVWIWLIGVFLFSLRFCGGIWQTHKLKTQKNSVIDGDWENKFDVLCQTVGIYKPIKFLQSEIVKTPMVIGWLKPAVIVPSSVLLGLNPQELETILAHELIHIRRHDYFVNIFQSFIEIILFFHPLTWWISAQVRRERENACDDEVLKIFDKEPLLYANALANLEDFRTQANNLTPSNILAANGGNLMSRIQRIINYTQINHSKKSIFASVLAFLLTSIISISILASSWNIGGNSDAELTTKTDSKRVAIAVYSASQYLIIENVEDFDKSVELLTNNLKRQKIPVVGYSTGGQVRNIDRNAREEKIVELWRSAGFEIGWSHLKFPKSYNAKLEDYKNIFFSKSSSGSFYSEFLEKMIEQIDYLKNKYGDLKKLSPEDREKYMQESMEIMKSRNEAERKWLRENNLKSATFTINAVDWMYSNIYDSARNSNDKKLMKYVQDNYLEYLSKIFDYYENVSQQKFNRKIPQTFGLEPSRLTADSIDRIVEMLKKRGYEFISMDDALMDEAFQSAGIGYGVRSSFFDTYPFPNKGDLTDKPKPHEDIMTRWYGKNSKK